ncbi:MAG TPA: SRPBCC family protein [Solirubrobacteraceae bacterium]|nr:SRPBCC family protein [Solirubrobacteraceae bacterium]
MSVRREIEIDAAPEDVWEALATEQGRERWLEDEAPEVVFVEVEEEPSRLVWWWSRDGDVEPTRVELLIVAVPIGSRVIVVESAPAFPLTMLAASLQMVVA